MNFEEESHRYTKDGKEYQSVTKWVGGFFPAFEAEIIANRMASKGGRPAEEILEMWDINSKISQNYGTSVHQAIEMWLRFGEITKLPHLKSAVTAFEKKFGHKEIASEIIVYNEDYLLAGTIDQLVIIKDKTVWVQDVKTNAELDKKKIEKYRYQLSTYKTLLELKGFKVEGISLEHWTGKEFKTIELEPVDLQTKLQQRLKDVRKNIR